MKISNIKKLLLVTFPLILASCNKLLEVTPKYIYDSEKVYNSDVLADSVVLSMYGSFAGLQTDLMMITGYSSDELQPPTGFMGQTYNLVYTYNMNPFSSATNNIWPGCYKVIGIANNIHEGVEQSNAMSEAGKNRILGQAKFMRALQYFYLINLYGDVPLVLTSDYHTERLKGRTNSTEIYHQIITDLSDAAQLLPESYEGERVLATKWAALALLSRVYLFTGEWKKAEEAADAVIAQDQLFQLGILDKEATGQTMDIFLKDSREQILQLWNSIGSSIAGYTLGEYASYAVNENTGALLDAFEKGDLRRGSYIKQQEVTGEQQIYKYRNDGLDANMLPEYTSVLRLGEVYLNRAEARIAQGNTEGLTDINRLRARAGLDPLPLSANSAEAQEAILQERRVELCFEWGDRWFTLKRTGNVQAVMSALKPDTWKETAVYYPIPTVEIQNNNKLVQNPGYSN